MDAVWVGITIAAVLVVSVIGLAFATRSPPKLPTVQPSADRQPSEESLRAVYRSTHELFVETDRGMWQIVSIFLPATFLIMGWVVINIDKLPIELVVVAGLASILLAAVATLMKHRLRQINLYQANLLARIEEALSGGRDCIPSLAPYTARQSLKAGSRLVPWLTSIHGVIDIHFVLFTIIWVAIWLLARPA